MSGSDIVYATTRLRDGEGENLLKMLAGTTATTTKFIAIGLCARDSMSSTIYAVRCNVWY